MKPSLTIVIPCFNSEDTLDEAVASCFIQGVRDIEVILVDDKSEDKTREIMKNLALQHKEIKLFYNEKNTGGGATRNTGIKHADGDVVFCLDSDDILPENTLLKMFTYLKEKNADAVGIHTSIKFIGKDINAIDVVHTFGYVGEKIPLESLLQKGDVYSPLYSTFMLTKKAFELAGGYPVEHGFDTQGFAWRFLAHGLTAYTCPEAVYLHRVQHKDSYYIREAHEGKINYNWRDIFFEHMALFNKETQDFIHNFDCRDPSKNFFAELQKRDNIFVKDVAQVVGPNFPKGKLSTDPKVFIKRNSILGIFLRIKMRVKTLIKSNETFYGFLVYWYALFNRCINLFKESNNKKEYYKKIEEIIISKKIIYELSFGGIGDCLVISTLPRLLKEKYGVDFYLSKKSLENIRHPDTFKLCFEMNPYFKGVIDGSTVFRLQTFESEKSLYTFLTDKGGETLLESLERQFSVKGKGHPEIYYKPNTLPEYSHIILIDKNTISGKIFGWKYREGIFEKVAHAHLKEGDTIEYLDPKKQDFFTYVDMLYSCKHFVGTFSGGASIASCFEKPFSVIWPYNAINGSNYNFCYRRSKAKYVL